MEDARRLVQGHVDHYSNVRLNSATGYITPKDMLAGRQKEIHAARDRKLEAARQRRQTRRQQAVWKPDPCYQRLNLPKLRRRLRHGPQSRG